MNTSNIATAKSRETLERAIDVVEKTRRWDARVVYGDTDSMFVLLEGRSVDEAFKIGEEIAEVVTRMNPSPVGASLHLVASALSSNQLYLLQLQSQNLIPILKWSCHIFRLNSSWRNATNHAS